MITNKYGLPKKIVELIEQDNYTYTPHRYSATEILNSTKEIILKRRHKDKLILDASEYINMLFGTAFHTLMETGEENEEIRLEYKLDNGATLSGRVDKITDNKVIDYKTCSVWKIKSGDFKDWEKQGLIYAWLLRKNGVYIEYVRFIAFMKDFSKGRKEFDSSYPESAIYIHEFKVTTDAILEIERFILNKINDIEAHLDTPDNLLPQPSDAELWKTPDQWASFKNGGKRALKIYDNEADAKAHVGCDYVEHREGVYKKLEYSEELQQLWRIAGE